MVHFCKYVVTEPKTAKSTYVHFLAQVLAIWIYYC